MISRQKARLLRERIVKAAISLSDEEALDAVELFEEWASGVSYAVGDRRRYKGKLYKCNQAHTSQSDWTPDVTPALWTEVSEHGVIPVWRQPTGVQDAYMTGDKVYYPNEGDDIYESTIDNNVWSPEAYPAGWKKE